MKISIEVDDTVDDTEVIIRCRNINPEIMKMESLLSDYISARKQIVFYKKDQEYYISLTDIMFFETDAQGITGHTASEMYYVKYKLYELEKILPGNFVRVSKSTIVNSDKIFSILRNITSASKIEFQHSHKKVFASRKYYKQLKGKLMEKRQ